MKNIRRLFVAVIIASILSGCASIPDMTTEQEEMVSEYAAALMLKYDADNHSRLVDVDMIINEYNEKKLAYENAEREYLEEQKRLLEEKQKEEDKRREENEQQESANSGNVGNGNDGTGGAVVIDDPQEFNSNISIEEYLELDGFEIRFLNYVVTDSYGLKEASVIIPEKRGNKLLVLEFDVKNVSGSNNTFDTLSKPLTFSVSVNNEKYKTLEPDYSDWSFCMAKEILNPGANKKYVIAIDVAGDKNVENIALKILYEGKKPIVKQLQ